MAWVVVRAYMPMLAVATPKSIKGKKCKIFHVQQSLRGESTTTVLIIYYLIAVQLMNQHNGQLHVTVDDNQLRTMASEIIIIITV